MVKMILNHTTSYLPIKKYIEFYNKIPDHLWSDNPIFYYRKARWDAMGLLGESPHKFNIPSKTLSLYFYDILGYSPIKICDNEIEEFQVYKTPKVRFIKALEKIQEIAIESRLLKIFNRAKEVHNDRYY